MPISASLSILLKCVETHQNSFRKKRKKKKRHETNSVFLLIRYFLRVTVACQHVDNGIFNHAVCATLRKPFASISHKLFDETNYLDLSREFFSKSNKLSDLSVTAEMQNKD